MMRYKDFVALANCISEHNKRPQSTPFTPDQLDTLAACIAGMNPLFKRERWLDLIT